MVLLCKYSNQSYTMRPYKETGSRNPVVTIDFNNKGEKIPVSFQLPIKAVNGKFVISMCLVLI
jgi:phospholipid transport system substrate-binding protein